MLKETCGQKFDCFIAESSPGNFQTEIAIFRHMADRQTDIYIAYEYNCLVLDIFSKITKYRYRVQQCHLVNEHYKLDMCSSGYSSQVDG
jgi:hypothetical protein